MCLCVCAGREVTACVKHGGMICGASRVWWWRVANWGKGQQQEETWKVRGHLYDTELGDMGLEPNPTNRINALVNQRKGNQRRSNRGIAAGASCSCSSGIP